MSYHDVQMDEMRCCGTNEIHALNESGITADDIALSVMMQREFEEFSCAHLILSEVTNHRDWPMHGADLERLVKKHELGTVLASASKLNINSGNHVRAYIWTPHYGRLQQWAQESEEWAEAMKERREQRRGWDHDIFGRGYDRYDRRF